MSCLVYIAVLPVAPLGCLLNAFLRIVSDDDDDDDDVMKCFVLLLQLYVVCQFIVGLHVVHSSQSLPSARSRSSVLCNYCNR